MKLTFIASAIGIDFRAIPILIRGSQGKVTIVGYGSTVCDRETFKNVSEF